MLNFRADDAAGGHRVRRAGQGQPATLTLAALVFTFCATGIGLLASAFTRSQIAAMFFTMIGTIIPACSCRPAQPGVLAEGSQARADRRIYPATHYLTISRGVFSKALAWPTWAVRSGRCCGRAGDPAGAACC
jgi:hypothetical protein